VEFFLLKFLNMFYLNHVVFSEASRIDPLKASEKKCA